MTKIKQVTESHPAIQSRKAEMEIPTAFKIGDIDVNKATLEALLADDSSFIINGIEDKAGYQTALKKRALYRSTRTTLDKVRKEMSAPHQEFVKELKKVTDELGEIAFKGEQYFDDIMSEIDQEKARIAKEKELAEQRRIQGRINQLTELGAKFDGEVYSFPYAESLIIPLNEVHDLGIQAFSDFICDVEVEYEKEQQRIANELLAQQQAEELRLQELEEQRLLAETNALQATALLEKRTRLRIKEITLMGYEPNTEDPEEFTMYLHDTTNDFIHLSVIESLTDEDWENYVEASQSEIDNWVEPTPTADVPEEVISVQSFDSDGSENVVINETIKEEYEPFGDKWRQEVMKWNKLQLVDRLREVSMENVELKKR